MCKSLHVSILCLYYGVFMQHEALTAGRPDLIEEIVKEIQTSGPITFARFMELALYHPEFGYYMSGEVTSGGLDRDRIGWDGDYYTSSDVHPVLGQAMAKQVQQVDERLGHPDPFTVVEMGAGKGLLARDLLAECAQSASFFRRLRYVLIERSPTMRAVQEKNLAPWRDEPGRLEWADSLNAIDSANLAGIFFSNELVDAFPVHRVRIERREAREIYVAVENERFVERLGELSTTDLSRYLERIGLAAESFPDGFTTEINLQAVAWMKEVARVLDRGIVMTIDYGHTAKDLYSLDRQKGTLLCYYHQMASEDPYARVGRQDMTAHVDFTTLATVGEEHGLHMAGFTNQMSFLMAWGVEETLNALAPGSADFQSIVQLLRPDGMGRTFKILIQHKGLERPELDGLRFKPFFGSALAATRR